MRLVPKFGALKLLGDTKALFATAVIAAVIEEIAVEVPMLHSPRSLPNRPAV